MTKSELIENVAATASLNKKQAGEAVNAVLNTIQDSLAKGESVTITGFGTFEVRERQAREGVRPGTTERIQIPASKYPAFKAGKTLKDSVRD
jgi:DNA-binding protein HU-beta